MSGVIGMWQPSHSPLFILALVELGRYGQVGTFPLLHFYITTAARCAIVLTAFLWYLVTTTTNDKKTVINVV